MEAASRYSRAPNPLAPQAASALRIAAGIPAAGRTGPVVPARSYRLVQALAGLGPFVGEGEEDFLAAGAGGDDHSFA